MKKRRDPLFWGGVGYLILLVLGAIIVPLVGPEYTKIVSKPFEGPGQYWLGTDQQGRDLFVRMMYGARVSLMVGLAVQLISLTLGITLAAIGVFGPKWARHVVLRMTDAMFAFPDILLAILIIAIRGPGWDNVIIALSITSWPAMTRLAYTQMMSLKDREYVVAARAMGASTFYIVIKHMLPQLWGILLAVSMVDLAATILAESTLSFLGIGVQAPMPSWGSMIDVARGQMNSYPMLLVWPCLILSLTIFALNFVGDGLRERFDPRAK